jgi:hypothetical protein
MTRLSTDPLVPNPAGAEYGEFSTFTVFARVEPHLGFGRRFDMVRDLEKIANRVEEALKDSSGSFGVDICVPGPVMFTHQFGQKPARLTITGFMQSDKPVRSPVTDRTIDHDNAVQTGPSATGGNLRDGTAPTADEDADVKLLKQTLEAMSSDLQNIFRIELNGVLYGENGRSFPL